MRKSIILVAVIITVSFISCKKTSTEASFKNSIVGDWLVVSTDSFHDSTDSFHNDNGIVVEWGLYYVNTIGIRSDYTFTVNRNPVPTGTWKLKDNRQNIVFYSLVDEQGTIYKDTTEFKISIDSNDRLILADNQWSFIHKRIQ
jgi:hypothetical protein